MMNKKIILKLLIVLSFLFCFSAAVQADEVEVLGWGWIGSSDGDYASPGLISFNCENLDPGGCASNDYKVVADTENKILNGWAWFGVIDGTTTKTIGWIKFSDTTSDYLVSGETGVPDFVDAGATYSEAGEVSGWARIMEVGEYGWNEYDSNEYGWIKLSGQWGSGSGGYGVTIEQEYYTDMLAEGNEHDIYAKFFGWGWSQEYGFVQFDMGVTEAITGEGTAWLQTLQGDIYSSGIDAVQAPSGEFNATYLILSSGSVQGFSSEYCAAEADKCTYETFETLETPFFESYDSDIYRSDIGKINIGKLVNEGEPLVSVSDLDNIPLAGKTYYTTSNLTIDQPLTITNGTGDLGTSCVFNQCLGNGTVVVQGDLTIDKNIR